MNFPINALAAFANGSINHDPILEWLIVMFIFDDSNEPHKAALMLMYYADYHPAAKFVLDAMLAMAED